MKKIKFLIVTLLLTMLPMAYSASGTSPYRRGTTYFEKTMPPSPGPASVVKYADIPFSYSCGFAEYEVPFYTLQGRELSVPIGLRYVTGGIKVDEIAGVAGLGWTLEAGGCVTRTVMDMPDEFTSEIFHHQLPTMDILQDLKDQVNTTETMNYLRDILEHNIDSNLDQYHFNVCGLSGSFVIRDNGSVYQFSGDGVKIEYTRDSSGAVDMFTLTDSDGTVYILSEKETATHEGTTSSFSTPMSGEPDRWSATTAWHITQMRSCSGLETAYFYYSEPMEWKQKFETVYSTVTVTCTGSSTTDTNPKTRTLYIHNSYDTKVLTSISLNGMSVAFSYSTSTGSNKRAETQTVQKNYPFRLTDISVVASGNLKEVARLEVGTGRDNYDGRIILRNLRLYKGEVLDDRWDFTYHTEDKLISRGSQDWHGYYNGENEYTTSGTTGTCPYELMRPVTSNVTIALTNGRPDPQYAGYMSLTEINHDGAISSFTYEGNAIEGANDTCYVGIRVKQITLSDSSRVINHRKFKYELSARSAAIEPDYGTYMTVSCTEGGSQISEQYTWVYTLYSSPITDGASILDTRIFYGKVTEDVTLPTPLTPPIGSVLADGVRTIYEYSTEGVHPDGWPVIGRFPDDWETTYYRTAITPKLCPPMSCVKSYYNDTGTVRTPLLTRKECYSWTRGFRKLISSSDYIYKEPSRECILTGYNATQVMEHSGFYGKLNYEDIYHYPVYSTCYISYTPEKEIHVDYYESGNDTTEVERMYMYRSYIHEPIRALRKTVRSAGTVRSVSYGYADLVSDDTPYASVLAEQNCLSVPLTRSFNIGRWINSSGGLTMLPPGSVHLSEPYKQEITQYDSVYVDGTYRILPVAHIEKTHGTESWRESVLSRDIMGNVSSFKERGRPETVILWSYSGRYPVAVIENATLQDVSVAIGGQSVIEALTITATPSQAQLGYLAGLRASLPNAQVTTYTYIPGIGVSTKTDQGGLTTTYEYDHAGRLACILDNDGNKIEEHTYNLLNDGYNRRSIRSKIYRSADGQTYSEDVSWWDAFGRKLQDISIEATGNGRDLVTAYESDFLMHDDVKTWLPYPVLNTEGEFQNDASTVASEYYDSTAYRYKNYEKSERELLLEEALPGYVDTHKTKYKLNAVPDFPRLEWIADSVSVTESYDKGRILAHKATDADGRVKTIFKDKFGRVLGSSFGTHVPTYHITDSCLRICAVANSGIELTDTLNMWRYSYDKFDRISSKGIPGSAREYYEYDDEDRIISIRKGDVLKEIEYDAFGRVLKVYHTLTGGVKILIESNTYDVYPNGVTGSSPKGLKTQSTIREIGPNGTLAGRAQITYSYDDKKRPVEVVTQYSDGSTLVRQIKYTFSGKIATEHYIYVHGTEEDNCTIYYGYDNRDRVVKEMATLNPSQGQKYSAETSYSYDMRGRLSKVSITTGETQLDKRIKYTDNGWVSSVDVALNEEPMLRQIFIYDAESSLTDYQPQYTGLIAQKNEIWTNIENPLPTKEEWYTYDSAGRLNMARTASDVCLYSYDTRGNIKYANKKAERMLYTYSGDKLIKVVNASSSASNMYQFAYDTLGRMTYDGTTGQSIQYNSLGLVEKISLADSILVNYFYLADGTKTCALDASGTGLVYRGAFVYRGGFNSSLTLESVSFGNGRITPSGVLLYATDYLGNVRAVVDGRTGDVYKASDYDAYGMESNAPKMLILPIRDGITLRDSYTGKESQTPDFGTGYLDFGNRQYSPLLRRWMVPDPMSESSYGNNPYAFCNGNPLHFVDPDGQFPDLIWDLTSIGIGVKNLVDNISSGNVRGAIGDGVGIAVDAVAALVPFLPGGVGALRTGAKVVDAVDAMTDAAKTVNSVRDVSKTVNGVKLKSFTAGNFRDNLGRLTGGIPDGKQAHHILPQKFEKEFREVGLNIHDPRYGTWLDTDMHLKHSYDYNKEWKSFFDEHRNYSADEVLDYANKLMKEIYEK